jgi:hypothetical protein
MRTIAALLTTFCLPLSAEGPVSKVAFSESRHAIRAFSASGEVTVPAIRTQLEIRYPGGRVERGDLVVVDDPATGHYFWRYTRLRQPDDDTSFLNVLNSGAEAVFIAADTIVDFYLSGQFYVQEHRDRANTLESAEDAAIDEIRRGLPAFEKSGYHTDMRSVAIGKGINEGFACPPPPPSPICTSVTKFASISREGDNWRLVIQNRWDQEVILDSKFNFVSTKRLSEPPNRGRNQ